MYFFVSTTKLSFSSLINACSTRGDASFLALIFILSDLLLIYQQVSNSAGNSDYTSSYSVDNHGSLYSQIYLLFYLYFKLCVYGYFCIRSKFRYYFIFVLQVILYSFSSVRLIFLMPIIIFSIYGYYAGFIKLNIQRLLVIALAIPQALVILLISRTAGGQNKYNALIEFYKGFDYSQFTETLYVALESTTSYAYLYNIINTNFVRLESGIFRNAFLPISRGLWGEKPEAVSRIIAKEFNLGQYEQGGGSVATIFGDGYINGHIIGILALCCIYAFIMSAAYRPIQTAKRFKAKLEPAHIMFYAITVHQSLFFFRGFLSENIWRLGILLLVFVLFKIFNFQKYTVR